ncbi:MAG: hypothetical protein U5N26_06915 [Candidatus Marinimicrobia bacterium]|nr:hypothetical protein [Candidatus Neomarinimicrobiota bacterium]
MAKCKYDPETFPKLAEGYARDGLTELQIAHNLGISKSTFETYKVKFPDFLDALKRGKGPVDFEVENALLKKALGHTYEETHTEIRQYKDGSTAKVKKVIEHYTPPDVIACIFWLKNRRPEQWREKVEDYGTPENMEEKMKEFSDLVREADRK